MSSASARYPNTPGAPNVACGYRDGRRYREYAPVAARRLICLPAAFRTQFLLLFPPGLPPVAVGFADPLPVPVAGPAEPPDDPAVPGPRMSLDGCEAGEPPLAGIASLDIALECL